MKKINVGLIGFGTIGTGVVRVLTENADIIKQKLGAQVCLKRVADKDVTTDRGIDIPDGLLTSDVRDVLDDPDISIVIELVGGTGVAKEFIISALERGKHVVTANKALLSTCGEEIFGKAREQNLDIGFEASVGGGIPILKSLREGLVGNNVLSISTIINGTANYILTEMTERGDKFEDVLIEAQQKGYAEADPSYDVDGTDSAHKLAILISLAFGVRVRFDEIYTEGIRDITPLDTDFARELGYRIKLLAIARNEGGEIEARVHPTMVPLSHPLATVDGVFNAVHLYGDAVDSVVLYGKGAGMMPTASAVVADVVDICRDIIKGTSNRVAPLGFAAWPLPTAKPRSMDTLRSDYYLRFSAIDKPGVLSKISGVLGVHNISISSVMQKERKEGGAVPVVIITHRAVERELRASLKEIEKLDVVCDRTIYIRMEDALDAAQ